MGLLIERPPNKRLEPCPFEAWILKESAPVLPGGYFYESSGSRRWPWG